MSPGPNASQPAAPRLPAIPTNPAPFLNLVKADKTSVTIKPGQSAEVTFTNTSAGVMSLTIEGAVPGIEAKFDRLPMKVGDKTVLTLKAGDHPKSGYLNIHVDQTGESIGLNIQVQ